MAQISPEQQLANIAATVQQLTTITRSQNGHGKSKTRAGSPDAIAGAARQLAEMVEQYLLGQLTPVDDSEDVPF